MTKTTSRATFQAISSMFGPYGIANLLMLVALILFVVFQPKVNDPGTHWALVMVGVILLAAVVFVVKGTLRLRHVGKSAREDRRRLAAGLPIDPEQPGDTKA